MTSIRDFHHSDLVAVNHILMPTEKPGRSGAVRQPQPHYADNLERMVGICLSDRGIKFIHESEPHLDSILDFYLPEYKIHIEVKRYHSERAIRQLAAHENVILLQGLQAVYAFVNLLNPTTT